MCIYIHTNTKHGRIMPPLLCHILPFIFQFSPHLCLFGLWFLTALFSFFAMVFKTSLHCCCPSSLTSPHIVDPLPVPPSLMVWSLPQLHKTPPPQLKGCTSTPLINGLWADRVPDRDEPTGPDLFCP